MTPEILLSIIAAIQLFQAAISSRRTAENSAMNALGGVIENLRTENTEKTETARKLEDSLVQVKQRLARQEDYIDVLKSILKQNNLAIPAMEIKDEAS